MMIKNTEKLKRALRGRKILLFGPPGSGKGNRSNDLKSLGLIHLSSGIALRSKVRDDPDSQLSLEALSFMERGELVPNDIIVPIIMEYLKSKECLDNGFVLDGFPRTKAQWDILCSQINLDLVIHLDVPRSHIVYGVVKGNRSACSVCSKGYSDFDPPVIDKICDKCGAGIVRRSDDNIETIENRLKLYDNETRAFLPEIEKMGLVHVLPITVEDNIEIDIGFLKTLKGKIYRVDDEDGKSLRMLNLAGMRDRLYSFLSDEFL